MTYRVKNLIAASVAIEEIGKTLHGRGDVIDITDVEFSLAHGLRNIADIVQVVKVAPIHTIIIPAAPRQVVDVIVIEPTPPASVTSDHLVYVEDEGIALGESVPELEVVDPVPDFVEATVESSDEAPEIIGVNTNSHTQKQKWKKRS